MKKFLVMFIAVSLLIIPITSFAQIENGITVNEASVDAQALNEGDQIGFGTQVLTFLPATRQQEQTMAALRTRASGVWGSFFNLVWLTLLQGLICLGFLLKKPEAAMDAAMGFGGIAVVCRVNKMGKGTVRLLLDFHDVILHFLFLHYHLIRL